jgi:hypothetical protein
MEASWETVPLYALRGFFTCSPHDPGCFLTAYPLIAPASAMLII